MQSKVLKKSKLICKVVIGIILFYETFKVIPNTEGWFVELTSNKNLLDIIVNDEILLPPLYPLFIWLLNKISSQLIFLRMIGFIFGFLLYDQSSKLIYRGIRIFIDDAKKNNLIILVSNISSIFLILLVCDLSTYLLWYDFTLIVLIIQILILNLFLDCIDNFYGDKRKYINLSCLIGVFLILGVLLKHSNMGVYLLNMQLCIFLIWILFKSDRTWVNKVVLWQFITVLLCGLFILINLILRKSNFIDEFLSASIAAKGGNAIVGNFILNGFNHLIYEIKRIDTLLLGVCLYFYFRKNITQKYIGILIFNVFLSYCIFNANYNLAGYSIKIIVILLLSSLLLLFDNFVFFDSLSKNELDQNNKFKKIIILLFGSIGCLIGNFTSAGLGYNGYFIGLVLSIILQFTFFIEILNFRVMKKIKN